MSEWQEGDVDHDGVSIHYYRTGTGTLPPLVLAHGFSDNGLCWTRVARALESEFDIVMVDARNHGLSDTAPAELLVMAGDLAAIISSLELQKPALLGHSMGASMVAELASLHPELPSRIVLEDPPWTKHEGKEHEGDAEKRSAGFRQYLASLASMTHEQILQFSHKQHPTWHDEDRPAWADSKKQVREAAMDGLALGKWKAAVEKIQCPALLVYADGETDGIVKEEIAEAISSANPNFSCKHIADAGHNTRREQFNRYVSAVHPFLSAT
jgi:N-formylmaleamate deformylase